jgi:phosphohistidine swiveling domain-containing protein
MITLDNYSEQDTCQIGSKAAQLYTLAAAGFTVPPLVTLTCWEVESSLQSNRVEKVVVDTIARVISADRYIVRSAVLSEDSTNSAQAGRFMSVPDVSLTDLAQTILAVAQDALEKTGDATSISIIVQEYLVAEYGGVLFTRHPTGQYGRVLEYQVGAAAKVVHGEAVEHLEFVQDDDERIQTISFGEELVQLGKQIETLYQWPQDIEWVVLNNQIHIVQTRPITTIDQSQYDGMLLLDQELPMTDPYYFITAPAAETFHNPSPLSFSILEWLHSDGGPVQRAYAIFGVRYKPRGEYKQFGSAVYLDNNLALQTLLPAYRYVQGVQRLQLSGWGDLLITFGNSWRLERLAIEQNLPLLQAKLDTLQMQLSGQTLSMQQSVQQLDEMYEVIFAIAFCAQKAVSDLERFLGAPGRQYLPVFVTPASNPSVGSVSIEGLQGNSLNIDDVSTFVQTQSRVGEQQVKEAYQWLTLLPSWKRHALEKKITTAQQYMAVREASRVMSVALISQLRRSVAKQVRMIAPLDLEIVSFATIDELLNENYNLPVWQDRRTQYNQTVSYVFPRTISSHAISYTAGKAYGVSGGQAQGTLVSIQSLDQTTGPLVLLVDTLYPEVVQFFPQIVGVVTRTGGLLSHAAIMAREAGLPVVVQEANQITIGSQIQINGSTGEVTEL